MDALAGSELLLEAIIRVVGVLWVGGAIFMIVQVRREAMIDGMISQISRMSGAAEEEFQSRAPDDADAAQKARDEAWEDRDDRNRRRWLASQSVVLAATGLSMAAFHAWASWMVAILIGAQGVYFIAREHAARSAPTRALADGARPNRSTVNAGWFSLAAAALVWTAHASGLLLEGGVSPSPISPDLTYIPQATPGWLAPFQTWPERHQA